MLGDAACARAAAACMTDARTVDVIDDDAREAERGLFFSLKWRALLLTSIVLLLVALGSSWLSFHNLSAQFHEQRGKARDARLREFDALMGQSLERLRQLAVLLPAMPGMLSALAAGDRAAVQHAFDPQWPALQLDMGLELIAFFDASGRRIEGWTVDPERADAGLDGLVARAREREAPQTALSCAPECVLFLAAPVLVEGRSAAVLLGANLAELVHNFAAVSGTRIGLLRVGAGAARATALGRLSDWGVDVAALTHPETTLPLLATASGLYGLDRAAAGVTVEHGGRAYELRVSSLPEGAAAAGVRLLVIDDISAALAGIRNAARDSALAGVTGWVGAELLLLVILWGPMSRLRRTANTLPLLAQGAFEAVRRAVAPRQPQRREDEIDILDRTTVALADRLEALEGQVAERTQTLSRRMTELAHERDFISSLLDTAQVAIFTLDAQGRIVMANPFAQTVTGYPARELVGRVFAELLRSETGNEGRPEAILAAGQRHCRHESLLACRDGGLRNVIWYHSRLKGEGQPAVLSVGLDITERRGAESRLAWMADHDTLTGLPNRRRLHEELELMLGAAQRQHRSGALLLIDLDQFKYVNEADGHLAGDRLLKTVANALVRELVAADLVARLGGDEFAVLVRDLDASAASRLAAEVHAAIGALCCEVGGRAHHVSASIGIVLFPEHGDSVEELLAHAELAMYEAKDAGRGHWHLFSERDASRERLRDRVFWKERVAQALAEDRFVLYFQPIMRIADGMVSHYEVLLRMLEPDGSVVSAGQFIEAAERSGLIHSVDRLVLSKAIHYLAHIHRRGIHVSFSLNLSGHTFNDPELLPHLSRELEASGVDTSKLIFEITETAAVADFAQATSAILAIKSLGCRFALDDFGIGFSSFAYLKHFPVDYLKIDGSFIRGLAENPDDQLIVRALGQIAAGFGKKTIAEYVEDEAALQLLREIGIDYAQGYFISQPRPAEDVFGQPLAREG